MYKIIGADKQEYGPVTAEQLRQWIAEGRVNGETMIQPEGSTEWKPLGTFDDLAALLRTPPLPPPGMIAPPATDSWREEVLSRDYSLRIGECLGRGFDLLKDNLWLLVGSNFLIFVMVMAAGAVPVLGMILSLIIPGPLYAGLYYVNLKRIRRLPAQVQEIFTGFQRQFVQLMLTSVVTSVLGFLSATIAVAGVLLMVFRIVPQWAGVIFILFGVLPAIYLSVSWVFALPLVLDRGMDFWPAMELSRKTVSRHWWRVFGLILLGVFVTLLGLVVCGVGMFFTMPIFFAALMYAYEEIFGPSRAQIS